MCEGRGKGCWLCEERERVRNVARESQGKWLPFLSVFFGVVRGGYGIGIMDINVSSHVTMFDYLP